MKELAFCSTHLNRFNYLEKVLPRNLKNLSHVSDKVEFVLVDFGSKIDVREWVVKNFRNELQNRYLRFYYTEALPSWHAAIAKNTTHYLANSEILFNLDCDNFVQKISYREIVEVFRKFDGSVLLHQNIAPQNIFQLIHILRNRPKARFLKLYKIFDILMKSLPLETRYQVISKTTSYLENGTYGRIAYTKNMFDRIGGYDQSFPPMGQQDCDIILRLLLSSSELKYVCCSPHWINENRKNFPAIKNVSAILEPKQYVAAIPSLVSEKLLNVTSSREDYGSMQTRGADQIVHKINNNILVANNRQYGIRENLEEILP